MRSSLVRISLLLALLAAAVGVAGEWPVHLECYLGRTPVLDGVISPGEYDDAVCFRGVEGWTPQFTPTTDPRDLSLVGYVKHDGRRLYFAFDVTDDVLYGIDTDRWLPDENPNAHQLTPQGYPWFGDEMELLINTSNSWGEADYADGDGTAWQMVCNLTKSRLGGIGVGGLLEGEPRSSPYAWDNYQRFILTRAMEAVAKPKPGGHGYVIEWAISFDPCMQIRPGVSYCPAMGKRKVGLNIAIGDLDEKEKGVGNFGNFHHEDWLAGRKNTRTNKIEWGSLWIFPGPYRQYHCRRCASRPGPWPSASRCARCPRP